MTASYHSNRHKIGTSDGNVKILMSKQYNKAENRKRRLSYIKRKKAAAKTKAKAKSKPAAA